jgi:hypothetical protein
MSIISNFKTTLDNEFSKALGQVSATGGSDVIKQVEDIKKELPENNMIKRSIKKSDLDKLIGTEKMKKPIGKLYSTGKSETKEATGSGASGQFTALFSKKELEEKWSKKYKDSIDCNNPKGFSQKAHCDGKVKKMETKEATGSASVGAYDAPGFEDVKMKGNHPKGSGRSFNQTQISGGMFVEPKEKCKKFPYCNQGDTGALKFTKSKPKIKKSLKEMITDLSLKYEVSEKIIEEILIKEFSIR